jgi:aminopeptidase YwaD
VAEAAAPRVLYSRSIAAVLEPAVRKILLGCLLLAGAATAGELPPLLDAPVVAALAHELSGDSAKRNLEVISQSHRMRASPGFRAAAEHVAAELRSHGLDDVEILQFPADGKTMFGTQKSRPSWDVKSAELWELQQGAAGWTRAGKIADWETTPLSLAQDSESANVTADLVDVGAGTTEADYRGKQVRGKLVLVSSQPDAVQALAVAQLGAAGIVSYAQNQRTAWWGENADLLRWGHLDSFAPQPVFAFMVRPSQARAWQQRLSAGQSVRLQASVDARRHVGSYDIVSARIRGGDPALATQEIVYSCHLDHPRPGANDNASGCAAILEVARTFAKLIRDGTLPRPARSLRFIWPPEIEGTTILLNARPDMTARFVAAIHMDMVGGGPETKAVFRVTRSPASLPTFVNDVAEAVAGFVNEQTLAHASGADVTYPLVATGGGKEALLAYLDEFTAGSDHTVLTDGAFRIPSVYLNDWPDRYIHTDRDLPANIDPTKLERAAFIGAGTGWYLANLSGAVADDLLELVDRQRLVRTARMLGRSATLDNDEAAVLHRFHWAYERELVGSIARFAPLTASQSSASARQIEALSHLYGDGGVAPEARGAGAIVYLRNETPKGPMTVFGYDYLVDHLGKAQADALALPQFTGLRADGETYSLEALNFVNGRRSVQQIRDALAAQFGPVPLAPVAEYLAALEKIGVLHR